LPGITAVVIFARRGLRRRIMGDEQGAVLVETGPWLRALYYCARLKRPQDAVNREVAMSAPMWHLRCLYPRQDRRAGGCPDLQIVHTNTFSTLPVGKARYGLMLREDGFVLDDGTTARLNDDHYFMTTTTVNAVKVMQHLEFCQQCLWPELDVETVSVTEQWAQFAIAGPRAREVLQRIVDPDHDISNAAFPYLAVGEVSVCGGTKARLFRLSFSGELAYEIAVPARLGDALVRALMEAGSTLGIAPYGTEALGVLRIEKGHPAGGELNGQTTAHDLGMGKMLSTKKDFIGRVMSGRPTLLATDRPVMVGLKPVDRNARLRAGAHLLTRYEAMPRTIRLRHPIAFSPRSLARPARLKTPTQRPEILRLCPAPTTPARLGRLRSELRAAGVSPGDPPSHTESPFRAATAGKMASPASPSANGWG
jgi:sarcosine oxidase subunit alpha